MDAEAKIKELSEKNAKLEEELRATKEHLKKYTYPSRNKKYYENNKTVIIERNKKYKSTPEQIKEYNKRAYLKRKEKLKKELEEKQQSNENI
jgi:uncharacterized protein YbaP (TraB family)